MSTANPKQYSRRCFLRYVGATAAAGVASNHLLGPLTAAASDAAPRSGGWTRPDGAPAWTPVPYPVPMPGDGGNGATDATRLATYVVSDELVLPQGFKSSVLVQWGDRIGAPGHEIVFGYNADYTGLVPIDGSRNESWLIVNHEYISGRPWLQGYASVHGDSPVDAKGRLGGIPLMGSQLLLKDFLPIARPDVRDAIRKLCSTAMADLGLSVLRVRRREDGNFDVVKDAKDHFRFCGASSQNVPEGTMSFTGPAAPLLGKPRGTFSNCSGATTPWGTFLTCEENVQDQVMEFITPTGQPLPGGFKRLAGMGEDSPTNLPFEFEGLGTGLEEPLDGRQYGWVCEIDPVNRTLKKHTTLGRFRHENVALRVEKGKRLAAYMGDDRRGGHIWKFVSSDVVNDPKDPSNSLLLERGTLYVARIDADMTGRWIPLEQGTPLRLPEPEQCATGHVWLPRRPEGGHVAVGTEAAGKEMTIEQWVKSAEAFGLRPFSELTLVDLVYPMPRDFRGQRPFGQPTLVMDAYVMANAVGGTPCARPEDVEVHPTDNSVYIAFTDSTGSDDGSPDKRIFPDSAGKNSRQYGAIYRLVEDGDDPAALTFTWGKFVSAGEAAEQGGGFACADNLAFDPDGNLWMVTDITTPSHNFPVDRTEATKTNPGGSRFPGLFGNNALFMIPTRGPSAGVPFCFAIGPMECEMTGPTFTDDGRTLILAIQHPGELNGTRGMPGVDQPLDVTRDMKLAARDGSLFTQKRTVPLGSNFPSREPGVIPRPCVVCITRA